MPANETLKDRPARYRQIKISVIGRKSGKTISIPVWFVLDGEKLYLLPVQGSDTQWYKNVLKNPSIRIDARGAGAKFNATARYSACSRTGTVPWPKLDWKPEMC
jgi:deazaflavin-dependent oxidoreductase (nitroreductase family)